MKDIIEKLIEFNKTVSTMESCTGGMISNEITNIPNASLVFKYGAVTYSNEFKIKMGVSKELIDKYSVYSMNIAKEMSKRITDFTNSNYGIGVTGKLMCKDINNLVGEDNIVFISIYNRDNDNYYTSSIKVDSTLRITNKKIVVDEIIKIFKTIIF